MRRIGIISVIAAFAVGMGVWGIMHGGGGNAPDGNGGNGGNGGDDVQSYTFTVASTDGGAVVLSGSTFHEQKTFLFGAGTVVSLKAVPDNGYQFVRWSGYAGTGDDVYAPEITVTVNGTYYITAKFEVLQPVRYSLVIMATGEGSVTAPGKGTYVYDAGTVVDLAVTVASGYEFAGWTGNVSTIADVKATSTTIAMNGDYLILANFREHRVCGE
jgi:Divergent InlB B-repeat domain